MLYNSTTISLAKSNGDLRYKQHLEKRAYKISRRADEAFELLKDIDGITCIKPKGSLYFTVFFNELPNTGELEIEDEKIKNHIRDLVVDVPSDKRFVYYLLGATGICVVPLTGFYSKLQGFRFTLLEHCDEKRSWIYSSIADSIRQYLK